MSYVWARASDFIIAQHNAAILSSAALVHREFQSLDGDHGNGGMKCDMAGLKDDWEQTKSNFTSKKECLCVICKHELTQPKDRLFSYKLFKI